MSSIRSDFFRYWMPYTFEPMRVAKARAHTYLPLNRDYKPLGIVDPQHHGGEHLHVNYEDYEDRFVRLTVNPINLKGIFIHDDTGNARNGEPNLYLYNDGPWSSVDYGERLQRLMQYMRTDWRDITGSRQTRYELRRQGAAGA